MKNLIFILLSLVLYGQNLNKKSKILKDPTTNKNAQIVSSDLKTKQEDEFLSRTSPVVVAIQHEEATGSGFIISEDGYILTNGHVVHLPDKEKPLQSAKRITVTLWNEKKYTAKVIGLSIDPDIALIKIDVDEPLKIAKIGNSKIIGTGTICYAFGSPYGIKKTLTKGIISRAGLTDLQTFTKLFQIDAIINPGNSGGPLFSESGEVIGINTYRSPKSGLGYSIPIHFAMQVKEHYLKYGRLIRSDIPYFFAKAVTQDFADYLKTPRGIFIDHVEEGSYAWLNGMREKDVIVKMNGQEVSGASKEDFYDWIWDISLLPVGSTVDLVVMRQNREGKPIAVNLSIPLRESDKLPSYGYQFGEIPEFNCNAFGFRIQEINPLLWFVRNLPRQKGVRISFVEKGSLAFQAGFAQDGVIYELNGKSIKNVSDFDRIMNEEFVAQKHYFVFKLDRQNDSIVIVLTPRYRIKNKKVLIISSSNNEYLPLYIKHLRAGGAKVFVNLNKKKFLKESWDAIILSGIHEGKEKLDHTLLKLLEEVDKSKVVLAGDRKSPRYFLEIDELKKLKITMDESIASQQHISGKINYTGEDIEEDQNLITTTAIDQKTAKNYIVTVIDSIYKNSFR